MPVPKDRPYEYTAVRKKGSSEELPFLCLVTLAPKRLLRGLLERSDERLQHLCVLRVGRLERLAVFGLGDSCFAPVAVEDDALAGYIGGIELVLLLLEAQPVGAEIHHEHLRLPLR